MESEREEGEISDEEIPETTSVVAPNNSPASSRCDDTSRDSTTFGFSSLSHRESSSSSVPSTMNYRPSSTSDRESVGLRIKVPGLSSSESEYDSDNESSSIKRKRIVGSRNIDSQWRNPLAEVKKGVNLHNSSLKNPTRVEKQTSAHMQGGAGSKSGYRKVNNIWGNVITEQTLQTDLHGFGVKANVYNEERTVESYDFTVAANDDRSPVVSSSSESSVDEEGKTTYDVCSHETFGNDIPVAKKKKSAKKRLGQRAVIDRLDYEIDHTNSEGEICDQNDIELEDRKTSIKDRLGKKDDMNCDDDDGRRERRKRRFGNSNKPKKSIRERLRYLNFPVTEELKEDDPVDKLVYVMSARLYEEKVELLERIVNTIGSRHSLDLLHETECIEETGGMLVVNGSRRRTPGGVFLTLLKDDKSISKEEQDLIFGEEQRAYRQRLKASRGKKRKKKKRNESIEKTNVTDTMETGDVPFSEQAEDLDDSAADIVLE